MLILLIAGTIIYFVYFKSNGETEEEEQGNYVQVLEDGTKQNTSSKLLEPKEINGIEITNISLTESNNLTKLSGTITNKTDKKIDEHKINIIFVNKEGEELTILETYVKSLEPGESTILSSSTTFDYSNAYDIKLTEVIEEVVE